MKNFIILLVLCLLSKQAAAQKAFLSEADLARLSYQLPDIDPKDSIALHQAVVGLATQIRADIEKLLQQYLVSDPSIQQLFAQMLWYCYTLEGNYQQALQHLTTFRSLLVKETDQKIYGLKIESYLQASLASRHSEDSTYAHVVKQTILSAYRSLPSAEMKQLVNQAKASYGEPYQSESYKRILTGWAEIRKNSGGYLTVSLLQLLLPTYIHYWIHDRVSTSALAALQMLDATQITSEIVSIPMRDGIYIGAEVFKNAAIQSSLPVIVSISPYPNPFSRRYGHAFASAEYIYVMADCRGRGKSEGSFIPFENEAEDIYDLIDWISKQPWCNGQVGMTGGSYLGFAQWAAIKNRHPALKAINPIASVAPGIDFPKTNNIYWPYMLRWLNAVEGKTFNLELFHNEPYWKKLYWQLYQQQVPFSKLDSLSGKPNEIFQRWLSHPAQDAYWDHMLPTPDEYARLDIPILTLTGYADDDQIGAFHYYREHLKYGKKAAQENHYLLAGPYDHEGVQWIPGQQIGSFAVEKEALIPIYEVIIGWFDWVLKGKHKPAILQDKVNYFVMGSSKWNHLPILAAATTDTLLFHLSSEPVQRLTRKATGSLVAEPVKSVQKTAYSFHTGHKRDSADIFSPYATSSDSAYLYKQHNVLYESEPLSSDIEISDFMQVQLYLSISVPDADFGVNLYELMPDGKSFPLGESFLRARYRESVRKEKLVKPGEINLYTFDQFFFICRKLQKGSRIRLTFQHLNSPYWERNYGRGGEVSKELAKDSRKAKVILYQGGKYPSQLLIPYSRLKL